MRLVHYNDLPRPRMGARVTEAPSGGSKFAHACIEVSVRIPRLACGEDRSLSLFPSGLAHLVFPDPAVQLLPVFPSNPSPLRQPPLKTSQPFPLSSRISLPLRPRPLRTVRASSPVSGTSFLTPLVRLSVHPLAILSVVYESRLLGSTCVAVRFKSPHFCCVRLLRALCHSCTHTGIPANTTGTLESSTAFCGLFLTA